MSSKAIRMVSATALLIIGLGGCASKDSSKPSAAEPKTSSTTAPESSSAAASEASSASSTATESSAPASIESSAVSAAPAESSAPADSSAPAVAAGGSPCDLLTEAEVATAIGAKQVHSKLIDQGPPLGTKQCLWATNSVPVKTYSLSLTRSQDMAKPLQGPGKGAPALFANSKPLYAGAATISGIGDEALIARSTIIARKGEVFISASTFFGASDAAIEALKSLTKTAVGKI